MATRTRPAGGPLVSRARASTTSAARSIASAVETTFCARSQLLLPVALRRPVCYSARIVASDDLLRVGRPRRQRCRRSGTGARQELVHAVSGRYRAASADEKRRILDEFVAVTGYHRKHAIRVFNGFAGTPVSMKRGRLRLYDEAVRQALVVFWEASDRVCGKRLKPLAPDPGGGARASRTSDASPRRSASMCWPSARPTIDRMLSGARAAAGSRAGAGQDDTGRSAQHSGAHVCRLAGPGARLCRGRPRRATAARAWPAASPHARPHRHRDRLDRVRRAARARGQRWSSTRSSDSGRAMPFPLRGIDTDNGSEFMNETAGRAYCRRPRDRVHAIASLSQERSGLGRTEERLRRSSARRLSATGGPGGRPRRSRGCTPPRGLFVNFFQPSFKLADKERVGAHVRKRYHTPETPCARLLASDAIAERHEEIGSAPCSARWTRFGSSTRFGRCSIISPASPRASASMCSLTENGDLDRFLKSLATAWRDGEVRPTHRTGPKPPRHWRTREDPFEAAWPRVVTWLESEPYRTSKELFERLCGEHPGDFSVGQLRTLQRRVKEWRRLAARRLVFAEPLHAVSADAINGCVTPQASSRVEG